MHFHLATVLLLAPLIAAAPTPNPEQGVPPADLAKEIASAVGQFTEPLGGNLPELPIGNARRQSSGTLDSAIKTLVELSKPPADRKRQGQSSGPADSVLAALLEISKPPAETKRDAPDAATAIVADVLNEVTGAIEKTKDQSPEASRKRQSAEEPPKAPEDVLATVVGLLNGAAGKAGAEKAKRLGIDVVAIAKEKVVDPVIGAASG